MMYAPTTLESASTDVEEKSRPPLSTVKVTPSEMIRRSQVCSSRFLRLYRVAKLGTKAADSTAMAMMTSRMGDPSSRPATRFLSNVSFKLITILLTSGGYSSVRRRAARERRRTDCKNIYRSAPGDSPRPGGAYLEE